MPMWERIPKTTFITVPNLEFGKASVLVYENLNFVPDVHMLRGYNKYNIKK